MIEIYYGEDKPTERIWKYFYCMISSLSTNIKAVSRLKQTYVTTVLRFIRSDVNVTRHCILSPISSSLNTVTALSQALSHGIVPRQRDC